MAYYLPAVLLLPVLVSLFLHLPSIPNAAVIVQIANGLLIGSAGLTRLNRTYYSFQGIPYAKPPVGEHRFEPPQPPSNWAGILNATTYGNSCAQSGLGNEDCLYLNVYSPKVGDGFSDVPLPVMVYIHGGFFQSGSSSHYAPDYFLDEDVILVTINYRLHSLGFLNTGDGLVTGNMGLKDMALALKWVQANIGQFGGDPKRVTIFGLSAGGAAVHYLLLSQLTKGLFNKAISQSGVATKLWSFQPEPTEAANLLAQRLNCTKSSTAGTVDCLKRADAHQISLLSSLSGGIVKNDLEVFAPSIEAPSDDAFLTKHPYDALVDGEAHRIPWISGSASGEGLLYINPLKGKANLVKEINDHWAEKAPEYLYYNRSRSDITAKITDFYFGNSKIDFEKQISNFTELWSDRQYISFTRNAAVMQAQFSAVYTYLFDYKAKVTAVGANHGEELFLLFPREQRYVGPDSKHYQMSRDLVKLWVQFATHDESGLNFRNLVWEPIDANGGNPIKYLYFSNNAIANAILDDPLKDRMQFWDRMDLYRLTPRDKTH